MGLEHVAANSRRRPEEFAWALGGAPPREVALIMRKYADAGGWRELLVLIRAVLDEAQVLADKQGWNVKPYDPLLTRVACAALSEVLSARLCTVCEGRGYVGVSVRGLDKVMPCPASEDGGTGNRMRCVDGIRPWGRLRRAREAGISEGRFTRTWANRYRELLFVILRWENDVRARMKMRMREG